MFQERDNFAAQCDESKKQLHAQRTGSQHLEDLIDKLQQDKKRLGLRVSKLTSTGIYACFAVLNCLTSSTLILLVG